MHTRKQRLRKAERMYASKNHVSVEHAMLKLRHNRDLRVHYLEMIDNEAIKEGITVRYNCPVCRVKNFFVSNTIKDHFATCGNCRNKKMISKDRIKTTLYNKNSCKGD